MPKYRQVRDDLRARIDKGEFPPGSRLPTRPELAEEYGFSVGTIADAIRMLRDEGYVETAQGSGIYALKPPPRALSTEERLARLERRVFGDGW
jgi:DNA-binding GntR family transcriptional regulator